MVKTSKLSWLDGENVRPYIFVRGDNRLKEPGSKFDWDWFRFDPLYKDPLLMDEVEFANKILKLESLAFKKSGMEMPRWVFFDCAIMPGFVAGFAHKTATLPQEMKEVLDVDESLEWTPISLFIIIPTMAKGEWVAHNLCSVNSLVARDKKFYGLGFLTKAYGLWHANIEVCCGMTQWNSPAIKLHSHYGEFEVLTSYTPVHSYAQTLTYRCRINPKYWAYFFTGGKTDDFDSSYEYAGFDLDPVNVEDLKSFQRKIEEKQGPFYLDSQQIKSEDLGASLRVYRPRPS